MTLAGTPLAPSVMWAQRSNLIFLSICLEDVKDQEIKVEPSKLYFKGVGGPEKKLYEVTVNFFKEIDPEKSKFAVRERVIEFALEKKEEKYWDRLLSDKTKYHWLKTDFNKWKDEDESDEEGGSGGSQDLEEMMRSMGGLGGPGGGFGGPGGMDMGDLSSLGGKMERPNLDDLDDEDSDDDLPDLN